jgi:hypothetical protein
MQTTSAEFLLVDLEYDHVRIYHDTALVKRDEF